MITITVNKKTKDLDGADLVRLIARAQDREAKLSRHLQAVPTPEPKTKMSMGNKIAGWFLAGVGLYVFIHVIIALVNLALDQVCLDLENEGYEVQPFIIPACAVNAPHRRDRVWIVGHAERNRCNGEKIPNVSNPGCQVLEIRSGETGQRTFTAVGSRDRGREEPWLEVAARLCRVDDGLPRGVDRAERLKALGNSVVPRIVEIIGRMIMEVRR
jgi:hypothetical protein